ncbi:MAG: MFS transporter [Betaproteobacteria bacterium]|nr:MFS transporter [Betaproteobacteria bacterium]
MSTHHTGNSVSPWLRIFLPFAAGYFLSYLLRNVNAVIAPELTRELGVSATDLGLLTSAYLFAFGAFQLPLGILLDRYGPRRVESTLLLLTAAGAALFAVGRNIAELTLARALIGLGVSACLMASFKAFSLWFPIQRLASLNAAIMAAGALGALTASTPLGWVLPLIGWRGAFYGLAGLALLAALLIFTTPDKPADAAAAGNSETLAEQLRGVGQVFTSSKFWRFAPQTALITGGFMAMQGLWAVPWLMNFSGLTRAASAFHLLLTGIGMLTGFVLIATFVTRLAARGIHPERILTLGMGGGIAATLLIVVDGASTQLLWFIMGMVFSVGNLSYALLSGQFPPQMSGRVNTALNLLAFVGAFVIQWGFGAAVDAFTASGQTQRDAYHLTYAWLLGLQAASYAWFVGCRKTVAIS